MMREGDTDSQDLASALAEALADRSMTLVELHEVLRANGSEVSLSTLSRWRSGDRQPDPVRSRAIIEAMELALGTPRGALLSRLPRRSRRIGSVSRIEDSAAGARTASMLAALGASPYENQRALSMHQQVEIDGHGAVVAAALTLTLQCVRDTVASTGFIVPTSHLGDAPPEFVVRSGGHRPRSRADADSGLCGFAMDLDRPLSVGETAVIEFEVRVPDASPGRCEYEVVIYRPVREIVQLFRFDPENVPYWIEEVDESDGRTRVTSVPADGRHAIHRIRSDYGPGRITMKWGWE